MKEMNGSCASSYEKEIVRWTLEDEASRTDLTWI